MCLFDEELEQALGFLSFWNTAFMMALGSHHQGEYELSRNLWVELKKIDRKSADPSTLLLLINQFALLCIKPHFFHQGVDASKKEQAKKIEIPCPYEESFYASWWTEGYNTEERRSPRWRIRWE